jgi:hypothetical protein
VAVNVAYRKRPAKPELNFVLALATLSCAPPASAVRLPSLNEGLDCVLVVFRANSPLYYYMMKQEPRLLVPVAYRKLLHYQQGRLREPNHLNLHNPILKLRID